MAFTARSQIWTMAYRYVGPGSNAGCIEDVKNQGVVPNNKGIIYITPHFFRFRNEAIGFLNLGPPNTADYGVYIDVKVAIGFLRWTPTQGQSYNRPGGGLECAYGARADVRLPVLEYFQTEADPTYVSRDGSPKVWKFSFNQP